MSLCLHDWRFISEQMVTRLATPEERERWKVREKSHQVFEGEYQLRWGCSKCRSISYTTEHR